MLIHPFKGGKGIKANWPKIMFILYPKFPQKIVGGKGGEKGDSKLSPIMGRR